MKKSFTLLSLILSFSFNAQEINFTALQGTWKNDGYGRMVAFKKNKAYLYDVSSINCTKVVTVGSKRFFNEYGILKTSDSTFTAIEGVSKYYFKKIDKLPALCTTKSDKSKDPLYNFDVLWQTFNENYCYFEERDIDWGAIKLKYRSQITATTTPFELFLIMDNIVTDLHDGHSNLYVPDNLIKKYEKYQADKRKIRREKLLDSLGQDFKLIPINVDSTRLKVVANYVKDVKTYNFGLLNYGLINKEIAIVQINGMEQYANYNIPSDLSEEKAMKAYEKNANKSKNYTKDNVIGASYIMDKIVSEIEDTKACIIDLRFNGGGYDSVQLEILKRFASKDTIAVYKKARRDNGFTRKTPFHLTPTKNAYKGRVFILTSYETASAAEDFTLCAMAARPDAVRIGSRTEGIFSDILTKKLPNGWEYGLSNEIYESPDGKSYEVIGIPPHHKIDYDKRQYWFYRHIYDNNTGKDAAIEKALQLIAK